MRRLTLQAICAKCAFCIQGPRNMQDWLARVIAELRSGCGCLLPDHQRGDWLRGTEIRQLFCSSRGGSEGSRFVGPVEVTTARNAALLQPNV